MCPRPEWEIIFTIQDSDDKTVFGYVCCSTFPFTPTLYAFKSEEVSETKEAL